MKRYGIIGEKLSHTISPQIHNKFFEESNLVATYEVVEISRENFKNCKTILSAFDGLNVTVPYKQDIMQFLDEIDDEALKIGAVNTVVNKNGKLCGYNSDAYGFESLLGYYKLICKDKIVAVLGSGGASKAVTHSLLNKNAKEIMIVSRNCKSSQNCEVVDNPTSKIGYIGYEQLKNEKGYLLINTTPLGMYPNCDVSPIEPNIIANFENICDIIYNPSITKLCGDSLLVYCDSQINNDTNNLASHIVCNGLIMLVAQAIKTQEFWGNCNCDSKIINKVFNYINTQYLLEKQKIIFLSGMMGCGKSTIGNQLAKQLNMNFVDLDDYIVERSGKTVSQMFEIGEEYFRNCESNALIKIAKSNKNTVVSLGGGALLKSCNQRLVKMAGVTIFLDRNLKNIKKSIDKNCRPLIKDDINKLDTLYAQRIDIYKNNCNFVVENNATADECVKNICKLLKIDS